MRTCPPVTVALPLHLPIAFVLAAGLGSSDLRAQDAPGTDAESRQSRTLPQPSSSADPSASGEADKSDEVDKWVPPEAIIYEAFDPPPGAKAISEKHRLWIDRDQGRVYLDGYVAMQDGLLEMFACPIGTKEHESVIGVVARSREVHAGLLAVNAQPGTPVNFLPRFVPATGQRIRVWVCYWDEQGKFQVTDARRWIKNAKTGQQMQPDWVFAGSAFWKDPSNGREYYQADAGDMICVSNFSSAMLDVPIASSAEANQLQFAPFTERIPEVGTPVRLVLVPIPIPTGQPDEEPKVDADKPPGAEVLPLKPGKRKQAAER